MSRKSSIGDSAELEGNLTLSDRLKSFKTSTFDPNAYLYTKCQHMNEKEIRHMCAYLVDLKKASAEEMRISVYANYTAFIRTSKEISNLEVQLLSMKNHLSTQSALVQGLWERVPINSLWADSEESLSEDLSNIENNKLSKNEDWLMEFLDNFEVLLAERRTDKAMTTLEKGENLVKEAKKKQTFSPVALTTLQVVVRELRQKLINQ